MRVKKAISEVVFSLLAFSRERKLGAVIRGSYPRYKSSLQFPEMSFIDSKCFCFYPSENPANGGSLHWIQPQCADAYNKLPSMVGSQPIICFLILDCSKYSQMGSSLVFSLVHWFFRVLKLEENYFYRTIRLDETNIFLSRILPKFQCKATRHLAVEMPLRLRAKIKWHR